MNDLDFGVNSNNNIETNTSNGINNSDTNVSDTLIHNPFFNKRLEMDPDDMEKIGGGQEQEIDIVYLCKNYKRLLIICLLGKTPISNSFYNKLVFLKEYQKMKSNLILIEANMKVLKNIIHFNNIIQVNSTYLEDFNHGGIELDESEIVLPIFQ